MSERARLALSQAAVAALVVAPALIITWAFRPGYMNADSLIAYSATKPWGDLSDWRAPLIEKLWDAFETAGVGSPTIVLFAQTLTMVAGFYLVMRTVLARVAAGVVAAALVFTPLVLSQVMLIGRDTWLTSFLVFQVGCAIRWSGATGRPRQVWLGLTLLAGMLVIASRQNAIVVEFFVLFCVAYRAYARRSPGQGRVRAVLLSVAVGGAACVLGFAVVSTLPRLMGARDVRPEAQLYAYDLTGMSLREDDVLLGPEAFPSQDLDVLRERWDSSSVLPVILPLGEGPILVDERFPEAIEELGDDWRREVRARPAAYLAVRWEMFQRILGVSHPSTYVLHPGIDGNQWGFAIGNHDANDAFRDYVGLFSADDSFVIGSDLFRPVIWLGLGLVAAAVLVIPRRIRGRPGTLEMGLLVVGAVAYEGTFFFLAMGEAYRYSYPLIVVSVLTLVFAVATLVRYRASATTDEGDLETSDDDDSTPDVGGAPDRSGHRADDSPPSPAYAPPATERARLRIANVAEVRGGEVGSWPHRRQSFLIAGLLVVVTGISVGLRLNSPVILSPTAAFDDALFAHQGWMLATHRWLGPYTFATLTKGPGYPLFIAAVYRLDLPLKLSEHLLHLVACGVLATAAWRMTRARLLAVGLFAALALDPSHLGWASSGVIRDNFYSGVSLLLVGSTLLLVGEVPTVVRRGARSTVPLVLVGGVGLGVVAATYFVTREERIWLGPTLALAVLAAALAWRRDRARLPVLAGVTVVLLLVAGVTSSWAIGEVRARNQLAYGSGVIGDLAEGEGARAHAEWQRVDVGPVIRWVTINTEQRHAVYEVSPAAAELAPHLEGHGTRWMGEGCSPPLAVDCEYGGGHFVWVLREAAWQTGHAGSAAELQRFLGRLADEIAAACDDGRVPCVDRGIAAVPPLSRVDTGWFWPSAHRITTYLFSFDGAEPGGASASAGTPATWDQLQRPLRGLDVTQAEYERATASAADGQWALAGLTDLYRWAARIGVIPALAGVALGLCTRQGRARYGRVAMLGLVLFAGAGSRIAAVTVVHATVFKADAWNYLLPSTAFLVGFLVIGWWILAHLVLDRRWAPPDEQVRGARREEQDPHRSDPDGVAARVLVLATQEPS